MPFQLLLMLGLACSSDCWIEKPLRAATWSAEPFNSFFAGAMGVAAAAALIGILAAAMKGRFFLGTSSALQNEPHCVDQHFIERCNLFAEPESVHRDPATAAPEPRMTSRWCIWLAIATSTSFAMRVRPTPQTTVSASTMSGETAVHFPTHSPAHCFHRRLSDNLFSTGQCGPFPQGSNPGVLFKMTQSFRFSGQA